jgi:hypothetical protein
VSNTNKERGLNFQFIPVPINAILDSELKLISKLLLGQLILLSKKHGYSFASNEWLSKLLNKSPSIISSSISNLKQNGYITTKGTFNRKIFINYEKLKKIEIDILRKNEKTSAQKREELLRRNAKYNNRKDKKEPTKKSKTSTDRTRYSSFDISEITTREIEFLRLLENEEFFKNEILQILNIIMEVFPIINYDDIFKAIDLEIGKYNKDKLLVKLTDIGLKEFILQIFEDYYSKNFISNDIDGINFSIEDPYVIKRVDKLYKTINHKFEE